MIYHTKEKQEIVRIEEDVSRRRRRRKKKILVSRVVALC